MNRDSNSSAQTPQRKRFSRLALVSLCYTVFVIVWGAFVRATGSGAGCGAHWPKCDGAIIPREPTVQMMIEFFHRTSSGLALVLVAVVFVLARKQFAPRSAVRRYAKLSLVFIIIEALIGALIVLARWVEYDQSLERVISIALHLVNTLFLIAWQTLTWRASLLDRVDFDFSPLSSLRPQWVGSSIKWLAFGFFILGATGAWTALGDTLFPAESLTDGFDQHFLPRAHFLVHLRVLHPLVAIVTGLGLLVFAAKIRENATAKLASLSGQLAAFTIANLLLGVVNVALLAPVWMQMVHLTVANLIWISFVSVAAERLATPVKA